jgi:DnaJ like chaperone protein
MTHPGESPGDKLWRGRGSLAVCPDEILESKQSDDAATLKKNYRNLVKKHHPDIISGQGAAQNIIDEATRKLQEINEAYELIKKDKGI